MACVSTPHCKYLSIWLTTLSSHTHPTPRKKIRVRCACVDVCGGCARACLCVEKGGEESCACWIKKCVYTSLKIFVSLMNQLKTLTFFCWRRSVCGCGQSCVTQCSPSPPPGLEVFSRSSVLFSLFSLFCPVHPVLYVSLLPCCLLLRPFCCRSLPRHAPVQSYPVYCCPGFFFPCER